MKFFFQLANILFIQIRRRISSRRLFIFFKNLKPDLMIQYSYCVPLSWLSNHILQTSQFQSYFLILWKIILLWIFIVKVQDNLLKNTGPEIGKNLLIFVMNFTFLKQNFLSKKSYLIRQLVTKLLNPIKNIL